MTNRKTIRKVVDHLVVAKRIRGKTRLVFVPVYENNRPTPLERLRHHVTGAIERGEAKAIVEKR
jgi:hypothetical protein